MQELRTMMRMVIAFALLLVCLSCRRGGQAPVVAPTIDSVPPVSELVIYEIFVRNFTPEGTLSAIIPHLERLKKLGVNVLWLMPIQPNGVVKKKGTYGSPYAIANYTDIHPDYGTKADFRRLVDSAHALGMFVIMDAVVNHTAWDHVWIRSHPQWYTRDAAGNIVSSVPDWSDIADLNYDEPNLWQAQMDALAYWIDSFHVDGYRCDVAEMVPLAFWDTCIAQLRAKRPIIMLAEGADPRLYDVGFDMTYGWELYHGMKKVWNGLASAKLLDTLYRKEAATYPSNYRHLRFITNHDEHSWDDVPQRVFVSEAGARAALVFQLTMPGVPLLYNGQETGYAQRINLFEKYDLTYDTLLPLYQWYQKIINLYWAFPALRKGSLRFYSVPSDAVVVYERTLNGADSVVVLINCRPTPTHVTLPESIRNRLFHNIIDASMVRLDTTLALAPYEYFLLTRAYPPNKL